MMKSKNNLCVYKVHPGQPRPLAGARIIVSMQESVCVCFCLCVCVCACTPRSYCKQGRFAGLNFAWFSRVSRKFSNDWLNKFYSIIIMGFWHAPGIQHKF